MNANELCSQISCILWCYSLIANHNVWGETSYTHVVCHLQCNCAANYKWKHSSTASHIFDGARLSMHAWYYVWHIHLPFVESCHIYIREGELGNERPGEWQPIYNSSHLAKSSTWLHICIHNYYTCNNIIQLNSAAQPHTWSYYYYAYHI